MQLQDTLSAAEFNRVRQLVYEHCGIHLHEGKMDLVKARIAKRLRAHRCPSVSEYLARVAADATGVEVSHLIDEMSTNLTSFFRESGHFEYLQDRLLPALLADKKAHGSNRLRLWSAACSSGQEPYTLAMALLDSIPDIASWDVKILATDISTRVLAAAQEGRYDAALIDQIPAPYRAKYLRVDATGPKRMIDICDTAKSMIRFRRLNLVGEWPFGGPFDVIFCRNVLIYFDQETQKQLITRFWNVLDRPGTLFTGHSESLNGIDNQFTYVQPTIYRKGHA